MNQITAQEGCLYHKVPWAYSHTALVYRRTFHWYFSLRFGASVWSLIVRNPTPVSIASTFIIHVVDEQFLFVFWEPELCKAIDSTYSSHEGSSELSFMARLIVSFIHYPAATKLWAASNHSFGICPISVATCYYSTSLLRVLRTWCASSISDIIKESLGVTGIFPGQYWLVRSR